MTLEFRPAAASDLNAIVSLGMLAFSAQRIPEQLWCDVEASGYISGPHSASVIVKVEGKLAGFALARVTSNKIGELGWVAILPSKALAKAHKRMANQAEKGVEVASVGRQLANKACARMRELGAETLFADIDPADTNSSDHLLGMSFKQGATRLIMVCSP